MTPSVPNAVALAPGQLARRRGRGYQLGAALLYNLLLAVCFPLIAGYLLWRLVVQGKSRQGLRERLGSIPADVRQRLSGGEPVVWVHAVSVGEVTAARPIIRELRRREPLIHIVLSTTTPTGRAMAERGGLDVDAIVYFPLDFPFIVHRTLNVIRPRVFTTVDTEIWPNLLWMLKQRGARTAIVNAKISDRSHRRSRFIRPLYAWALSNVDAICAQSSLDVERFLALCADPAIVRAAGNAKFDEQCPQITAARAAGLRQELGIAPDCPVVVAGSTNPGEEGPVLDAFWRLRVAHTDARLLIAPRHPERTEEVAQVVLDHGWAPLRRTEMIAAGLPEASGEPPVIVLDTIGELAEVYGIATVAFVGGSLIPKGGHNVLQPIAQGKPVLFGPHMQNQKDIAAIALREGVAWSVADAEELAAQFLRLVESPRELERVAALGPQVIEKYRGASVACAERLVELLEATP
jgi:3-deoxy-D-manno-octulosonic-acid transferase